MSSQMASEAYTDQHVFDGGPPLRLQKSLGLVKPDDLRVRRRALFVALLAWAPPAGLAIAQSLIFMDGSAGSFLRDFSVHARYLIAAPALVLAEGDCIPRLEKIVRHFVDTGLITTSDMTAYQKAVDSTRRLLNSKHDELIATMLAYVAVFALMSYVSPELIPHWQRGGPGHFSLAGWWHVVISLPMLLLLFFGWLWRLALWARFLLLVAGLNLQLVPSHPDRVGGLQFVSTSLRGFRLISFGLGAVVAGAIADRVVYYGADLLSYKTLVIGLVAFILVLFAGPLTVFIARLRQARRQGIFEYGALANRLGREFESKWLHSTEQVKQEMLAAPDFSATTDFYSVAANAYEMRDVPFKMKELVAPVLPALVPFVVVALFTIPVQIVIDSLIKLLF
jgi:hypothetical protein